MSNNDRYELPPYDLPTWEPELKNLPQTNEVMDIIKTHYGVNNISWKKIHTYFEKEQERDLHFDYFNAFIPSLDKYYYMASLLMTKPSLVNPRIYSSDVSCVRILDYVNPAVGYDEEQRRLTEIFKKPILKEDLQYILCTGSSAIQVVREILMKDQSVHFILETWGLIDHTVKVLPIHRALGPGFNNNDVLQSVVYTLKLQRSPTNALSFTVNFKMYCPMDYTYVQNFRDKLKRKLGLWAIDDQEYDDSKTTVSNSLLLISSKIYLELYKNLKQTYYGKLKQIWIDSNERTDPEKYIPEDLGIAAYIHALNDCRPRKFVDLGCGNGLLVYLLTRLGWEGYGIDFRTRKLWTYFIKEKVELKQAPINPFETVFNGADDQTLFIGNHCDELTPWIPFIASRTKSPFFIIPCCSYKFDQTKFEKSWGKKSSDYGSYLEYIKAIAEACNYDCQLDRLRIPSTKRMCLVGEYEPTEDSKPEDSCFWQDMAACKRITFGPKADQKVLNGTRLPKDQIDRLVFKIFNFMIQRSEPEEDMICEPGFEHEWNRGGRAVMCDLVLDLLDDNDKKLLKDQAKGLQTLIRNHGHVLTYKESYIRLRVPTLADVKKAKCPSQLRKAPCYYFLNHPNGCPMSDENCAFDHNALWLIRELFETDD